MNQKHEFSLLTNDANFGLHIKVWFGLVAFDVSWTNEDKCAVAAETGSAQQAADTTQHTRIDGADHTERRIHRVEGNIEGVALR